MEQGGAWRRGSTRGGPRGAAGGRFELGCTAWTGGDFGPRLARTVCRRGAGWPTGRAISPGPDTNIGAIRVEDGPAPRRRLRRKATLAGDGAAPACDASLCGVRPHGPSKTLRPARDCAPPLCLESASRSLNLSCSFGHLQVRSVGSRTFFRHVFFAWPSWPVLDRLDSATWPPARNLT